MKKKCSSQNTGHIFRGKRPPAGGKHFNTASGPRSRPHPEGPQEPSHRLLAGQHLRTPAPCGPRLMSITCCPPSRLSALADALPGGSPPPPGPAPEHPRVRLPRALGERPRSAIQAEGRRVRRDRRRQLGGRRADRATRARQDRPRVTLVTPASNCRKGEKAGEAAGARRARGKTALGGCGPGRGRPAPPGPPQRRDFLLLQEPALRPGEGGRAAGRGAPGRSGGWGAREVRSGRDAHPPAKR